MRVLRVAGYVLAAIVGVVVVALAVTLLDPAPLLARALPAIERATGRTVTVAGARLDPSLPGLVLTGVTLTAADPDIAPQSVRARRVAASIALGPLLSGRIEVGTVAVVGVDALFATDAQGALHVRFGPPPGDAPPPAPPVPGPPVQAPARAPMIGEVRIAEATVTLRDRRSGVDEQAVVGTALARLDGGGAGTLTAAGSLRGVALGVDASAAARTEAAWPAHIVVTSGQDRASFDGTLGAAVAGTIALAIPDPALITPLLGRVDLPPLDVAGEVSGTATQGRFDLRGVAYGSKVHAAGDVVTGPRPSFRATVTADRLDPAGWTRTAPVAAPAAPALPPAQPPVPAAPIARPDQPLPPPPASTGGGAPDLRALNGFDADLTLSAGVVEPGLRDVGLHAVLAGGVLTADPIRATYEGVTASGRAVLDARAAVPKLRVVVPGVKIPVAALAAYSPVLRGAEGAAEVYADVQGTGADAPAMVASLSGRLGVAMVGGGLAPAALAPLLAAAHVPIALPGAVTVLRCLAVRGDFLDGRGQLDPIVLDGAALRLTGAGTIDLGGRTMDLVLHPLVRAGGFGVSVPVSVRGPLTSLRAVPDIAPGRNAAGLVIGALQAAAEPDPCPAGLAAARFLPASGAQPAPAPPPAPTPKAPKPADLLRQFFR